MDVMTLAARMARLIDEEGLGVKVEDLTEFGGRWRCKGRVNSGGDRVRPAPNQTEGSED